MFELFESARVKKKQTFSHFSIGSKGPRDSKTQNTHVSSHGRSWEQVKTANMADKHGRRSRRSKNRGWYWRKTLLSIVSSKESDDQFKRKKHYSNHQNTPGKKWKIVLEKMIDLPIWKVHRLFVNKNLHTKKLSARPTQIWLFDVRQIFEVIKMLF